MHDKGKRIERGNRFQHELRREASHNKSVLFPELARGRSVKDISCFTLVHACLSGAGKREALLCGHFWERSRETSHTFRHRDHRGDAAQKEALSSYRFENPSVAFSGRCVGNRPPINRELSNATPTKCYGWVLES